MKKGTYILEFKIDEDDVDVAVYGGISGEEIAQLFVFCVNRLVELGGDVEVLKSFINGVEEKE